MEESSFTHTNKPIPRLEGSPNMEEKNPKDIPLGRSSHKQQLPEAGATADVHLDLLKDLKKIEKGLASDTGDVSLYSSKELMEREMVLKAREEQLNKKEQELARREEALAIDNIVIKKKNVECIIEKYSNRWQKEFGSAKTTFVTSVAEIHRRNISDLKSELVSTLTMCNKDEQSTTSFLKEMSAVEFLSRDFTADVMSTMKAVNERPRKSRSDVRVQNVALIYDERLLAHKPPSQGYHRERPERLTKIKDKLVREGLWERCQIFDCDEADMESLEAVHDREHISKVQQISSKGNKTVDSDMYYSSGTTSAALLAAGGAVKAADLVANGLVEASFAIIRPPGHHVGINGPPNGFCFLNNISIAAAHLLNKHGMQRILIVDWDIHHGDGTQKIFYNDNRVLFFSVHRGDDDMEFPCEKKRTLDNLGEGDGRGYNINICWRHKKIRDVDYYFLWDHVLLPICKEFNPEIILISAGFDAAKGDDLGKCDVTPNGFATLLRKLKPLAPIVMALEGGYNATAISLSAAACLKVLLGEKTETIRDRSTPYTTTISVASEAQRTLAPFWKCMESDIPVDVRTISAPKKYQEKG